LIADLKHICEASNLGASVQIADVPLSNPAKIVLAEEPGYIDLILSGGDDFELLFTAGKSFRTIEKSLTKDLNVSLTRIGMIVRGRSVEIFDVNGDEYSISKIGYTHF
jgi:thiamine-monophosphate kinase